jgi:hypothetical protein
LRGNLRVSSDDHDWQAAKLLVQRAAGYGNDFALSPE